MRRILFISIAVIMVIAFLIYGRAHLTQIAGSRPTAGSGKSDNLEAPNFELAALDGHRVKLSDFRGKAVVLNFWATYCAPCRIEMPWLIDFQKKYQAQGLEILGVSMDDDGARNQVSDFVKELGVNYTILLGDRRVGDAYGGARFLPQSFLIDRNGRIVRTLIGMPSKAEFENTIKKVLNRDS